MESVRMLRAPWQLLKSNPYGVVIIAVAALAMVATLPGRMHGLAMVTERLLEDPAFELTRVSYADMNLWATLIGGLFCLPCGWLIDRFGLRITLTVTVASLGAVVLWMTWLSGWWSLFTAIVLTRGFGQSALAVISITMVGKWYTGRLSLPMAVYSLLLSLGFALAAQFAKPFAHDEWCLLWSGIGWMLLLGMAPLALLLTRDPSPTSKNAKDAPGDGKSGSILPLAACCGMDSAESKIGFTPVQAMRTQAFWVFGLGISLIALMGSSTSLFNESVLNQQGFPPETFYNLITLTGIVGLLVKLPVGWLGQRCALNLLQAIGLFLLAVGLLWLPCIYSTWALTVYGVIMGVSGTITTALFFAVWGQAFGRAHLGQIQAIAQMLTVVASAAGPKVFAECFTRYGSYAPAFQALAGFVMLLGVWSAFVHMPSPQESPEPVSIPLTLTTSREIS
jgi:MFS family permease